MERTYEKWICFIAFVCVIILHLLTFHFFTIIPYIIIFFFLSLWVWEECFKDIRRIKTIIREKYSYQYDFNKEYMLGHTQFTIIQFFPYIEGELTKVENLFLKYFQSSLKINSGSLFRRQIERVKKDLEEIFEIIYKVRGRGYKNLKRIKTQFDELLESKVNFQLDSLEFQTTAENDPYYDKVLKEIKANCTLFFDKMKRTWFFDHIRNLKQEIHSKDNIETYDLRRFGFMLESSISNNISEQMNNNLRYLASIVTKYNSKDYLKLLTNLYGLNYDGKIRKALTIIRPYLIKFENNRFSSLYTYVKDDSKLLYKMIMSYKKYINYKIVKDLQLEKIFTTHLKKLNKLSFPDRAERIERIENSMRKDQGWQASCERYQKYLTEFDTLREDKSDYIHEQYLALKKILAFFSKKFREDIKQKDGTPSAWAQFNKIKDLIERYQYTYNLESFTTLLLKFRGILESKHIKTLSI